VRPHTKHHKCLMRHSGVLPGQDLTEYAYALAKADRYQEAIDELTSWKIPIPRARSTTAAMRPASWDGPTKELATILSRSRSILLTRRCASTLGGLYN
jgi:hypothetical protein